MIGRGVSSQAILTRDQHDLWVTWTGSAWEPFRAAWLERGLRLPPTERQRQLLWEIADARPNDLAHWVREAPRKGGVNLVVEHVLRRWLALEETVLADDERVEAEQRRRVILNRVNVSSDVEILGDILRRLSADPRGTPQDPAEDRDR